MSTPRLPSQLFPSIKKIFILSICLTTIANIASATDIPIESYVTGGLTIQMQGDWQSGINFNTVTSVPAEDTTVSWEADPNYDFLNFADDSTTDGFYITVNNTDFIYNDALPNQNDIPAQNLTTTVNYDASQAAAPAKGFDDATKNLSILPETCGTAQLNQYDFHADYSNPVNNYGKIGSTTASIFFTGSVNCLNLGHLRIDRLEAVVPAYSRIGTYTTTITFTAIDGLP